MGPERTVGQAMLRNLRAIVISFGLTGCFAQVSVQGTTCLEMYPGWAKCCEGIGHPDNGICCPFGEHAVSDVDHPDWKLCAPDVQPHADGGDCPATDTDAETDAGDDSP